MQDLQTFSDLDDSFDNKKNMSKLEQSFKKVLEDFNTVNWSETDGSDVKEILKTYFDDISNNKSEIKKLISECTKLNKFAKYMTTQIVEAC